MKLEAVAKNIGITAKGVPAVPQSEVLRNADDEKAMARVKMQASTELFTRRMKATKNAFRQTEHAIVVETRIGFLPKAPRNPDAAVADIKLTAMRTALA